MNTSGTYEKALPSGLPGTVRRLRRGQTSFGALTAETAATGYDLCGMANLSAGAYPALRTCAPGLLVQDSMGSGKPHGVTCHCGEVIFAQGTGLYASSGGQTAVLRGTVSDTDKVFAPFGDDLLILPDKLIYHTEDHTLVPFELDSGLQPEVTVDGSRLLSSGYNFSEAGFRAGDCIYLQIEGHWMAGVINGHYRVKSVLGTILTVAGSFPSSGTFSLRIIRVLPDLDGLCAVRNRLFGFKGHQVLVAEADNPANWFAGDPDNADVAPVVLTTGESTAFTACIPWQGVPVFFKANRICRLSGHFDGPTLVTSSMSLTDMPAPGVMAGMASTLCELGGVLCYVGAAGVYSYSGTYPVRIGDPLCGLTPLCGGTDGRTYMLSAADGEGHGRIYLFRPSGEAGGQGWYQEDSPSPVRFMLREPLSASDGDISGLDLSAGPVSIRQTEDGRLWAMRSMGPSPAKGTRTTVAESTVTSVAEFGDERACEPEGMRLVSLYLRACGGAYTTLRVRIRYDDMPDWEEVTTLTGASRTRLYHIPLLPRRCHWYRLRLEMIGDWLVSGLWRDMETADS